MHGMLQCFLSDEHKLGTPEFGVHPSESISNNDPRAWPPEFIPAKKKEIAELLEKRTWRVCIKSELPPGDNIMGGWFVLSIEDAGTDRESYKARYAVQGFRDKENPYLVHQSLAARHQSTKLLVAVAAVFGFRIFTHDVRQAYPQSADKLKRDVYISPS
jgi:hypothetical protein